MKSILFTIIIAIAVSIVSTPSTSLAQSEDCGKPDNPGQTFDIPGTPTPDITPSPFNPDLGYKNIKDCLPVSNFENMSWEEIITKILETINYIIGFLALFGLIVSGIMYITAGGDADKAKKAQRNIIWIITGILIYMLAFYFLPWIRAVVEGVFQS